MKNNLTKLAPTFTDGMPREVATALLTEPKARLTNAFRKTCKRARESVYTSAVPLRTNRRADSTDRALYFPDKPIIPPPRNRLSPRTVSQLGKWLRRAIARRHVVQKKYVLLEGKSFTGRAEKLRLQTLAVLGLQAKALEEARDTIETELTCRGIPIPV